MDDNVFRKSKVLILHNIISPYKTLLFNELYKLCPGLIVLYMADTESNRDWDINKDDLKCPYEVLFQGQLDKVRLLKIARKTWTRLKLLNPDVLILGGYSYAEIGRAHV